MMHLICKSISLLSGALRSVLDLTERGELQGVQMGSTVAQCQVNDEYKSSHGVWKIFMLRGKGCGSLINSSAGELKGGGNVPRCMVESKWRGHVGRWDMIWCYIVTSQSSQLCA